MFVYGTLRKGMENHRLVAHCPCLGTARTCLDYALYLGRYPYCLKNERLGPVTGEVYRVDHATLARLDILEDHPRTYRRELVQVDLAGGSRAIAWLYFHPKPLGKLLDHGDYAKHLRP